MCECGLDPRIQADWVVYEYRKQVRSRAKYAHLLTFDLNNIFLKSLLKITKTNSFFSLI